MALATRDRGPVAARVARPANYGLGGPRRSTSTDKTAAYRALVDEVAKREAAAVLANEAPPSFSTVAADMNINPRTARG
jgi:hypothetical protein